MQFKLKLNYKAVCFVMTQRKLKVNKYLKIQRMRTSFFFHLVSYQWADLLLKSFLNIIRAKKAKI